ncbi:hypothetical protein RvY_18042-2 [Ramazzottius varieornatus]|uniref:N-acetylgalactosaminide beta-1,3-galactosyltransferase n=1 Tax=Ramazzottius varieornatus TaxID=947166 RepID=A0A1D1W4B8_RAMVA|nr:hypothetical protein RvY_18042-2 [Ramazzottius varieornatus]
MTASLTSGRSKLLFAGLLFLGLFGLLFVILYGLKSEDTIGTFGKNVSAKKYLRSLGFIKADADEISKKNSSRVFCCILTQPENHEKAIGVKETWAKRCDGYIFVSSEHDDTLPALNAHLGEGRDILWGKTKLGFRYAYKFIDEYDWFLKADDDTYVIMENLKLLVADYSPNQPLYFGHHFRRVTPEGYMSGGAGYVLSQAALRKFVEEGLDEYSCLKKNDGPEDALMGLCLHALNVTFGDSRDASGHNRFFPFTPSEHMKPGHMEGVRALV